jgi:hypothetical protein
LIQIKTMHGATCAYRAMSSLVYRCPNTGEKVQIRIIEIDGERDPSKALIRVQCPICGHTHEVSMKTGAAG